MSNPEIVAPHYQLVTLTKDVATKFAPQLAAMADQIPLVDYSAEEILRESKGERFFRGNGHEQS